MSEHAVIVKFSYGLSALEPLNALEDLLEEAITTNAVGEYDGNEIAVDLKDGRLYMYGSDADALFAVVLPILQATSFMIGAQVVRRYGPAGDPLSREVLTTL